MGKIGVTFRMLLCIFSMVSTCHCEASRICDGSNSPKFSESLIDKTVKLGQNAAFACAASNFDPATNEITWQVRPDIYRKDITRPEVKAGVYISSITLYDIGTTSLHISCTIEYQGRQGQPSSQTCRIVSSATLLVEYFPDGNDLTCSHVGPLALRVGEILSVRCEVPRCEPAVDLTWKLSDQGHGSLPLPSITDVGLSRVLRRDLEIDQFLHLNEIVCLVTSEFTFPNEKLECTIGPITILRPPSVDISPRHVNFSRGDSFEMNCLTSGYPDVTNFLWTCSSNGILTGCDSTFENTSMSVLRGFSHDTDDVNVSCTATNREGSGTSNATVTVLSVVSVEPSDGGEDSNVVMLSVIENRDPCCLRLQCALLPNISNSIVQFQWIIDGWYIGQEDRAIRQESTSRSSFTFHSNFEFKANILVTCKIKIGEDIFESSQNIFKLPFNDTSRISVSMTDSFRSTVLPDQIHPNEVTKSIPNTRRKGGMGTTVEYSGKLETSSVTQWGDTLQSTHQLSTLKFVLIITGAVIMFIIITVCSVTLVSVFLYRHFTKGSNTMPLTNLPFPDEIGTPLESGRITESNVDDPMYEIPNAPTLPKPNPLPSKSISLDRPNFDSHHISSRSLDSSSCSSREYGTSSSNYYTEDTDYIYREYQEQIRLDACGC